MHDEARVAAAGSLAGGPGGNAAPDELAEPPRDVLPDLHELAERILRSTRRVLGWPKTTIRILLTHPAEQIHVRLEEGNGDKEDPDGPGEEVARRQGVGRGGAEQGSVTFPLSRGRSVVGSIEVMAPRSLLEERSEALQAVMEASELMMGLDLEAADPSGDQSAEDLLMAAGGVIEAGEREEAVRAAVRLITDRTGVPAAGWLRRGAEDRLRLVSARGFGSTAGGRLRDRLPRLPRWDALPVQDRGGIEAGFTEIAGTRRASTVRAGDAVIMVGTDAGPLLESIGSLLRGVLEQLTEVVQAQRRNRELDASLAWTAHEFRDPVLGVKAVVDMLLETPTEDEQARDLLGRAQVQLDQLADLVEPLMRWASGLETLSLTHTDLLGVIDDAVASRMVARTDGRVVVSGPDRLSVHGDRRHLRVAIANVVKNALAYSPPGTEIKVTVESVGGFALVTVQDQGPGIPPDEQEVIFDPFVRGSAGRFSGSGTGLGLFIGRRIVEAHGGEISLESSESGATFLIRLPLSYAEQTVSG